MRVHRPADVGGREPFVHHAEAVAFPLLLTENFADQIGYGDHPQLQVDADLLEIGRHCLEGVLELARRHDDFRHQVDAVGITRLRQKRPRLVGIVWVGRDVRLVAAHPVRRRLTGGPRRASQDGIDESLLVVCVVHRLADTNVVHRAVLDRVTQDEVDRVVGDSTTLRPQASIATVSSGVS